MTIDLHGTRSYLEAAIARTVDIGG